MQDPPRTYNQNLVFILGAGASADAGMPLVAGFLNRMRDSVEWLEQKGWTRELRAVQEVLRFRHQSAAASYRVQTDIENIEELFSLAAATSGEMSEHVNIAIAATLEFAREAASGAQESRVEIRKETGAWQLPPPWKARIDRGPPNVPMVMAGSVDLTSPELIYLYMSGKAFPPDERRRVTIITFNYDLVAEAALDALGVRWHYGTIDADGDEGPPPVDAVTLLKLHGSINWGRPKRSALLSEGSPYGSYQKLREAGEVPLLVPPTWQKTFTDAFGVTWYDAVAALRDASRVFILGFSIPASDAHFKYLLAAGFRDNISLRRIVFATKDPEQPVERLGKILRPELFGSIVRVFGDRIGPFVTQALAAHVGFEHRELPIRLAAG